MRGEGRPETGPSDLRREQRQPRTAHFQVGVEALWGCAPSASRSLWFNGFRSTNEGPVSDKRSLSGLADGWLGAVSVAYQTLKTLANFRMRGPWKSVQVQSRDEEAAKGTSTCRCGTAMPASFFSVSPRFGNDKHSLAARLRGAD